MKNLRKIQFFINIFDLFFISFFIIYNIYKLSMDIFYLLILILIISIAIIIVFRLAKGNTFGNLFSGGADAKKFKRLKMEDDWLDLLQDGKKKVDVRLNRPTFDSIDKGSQILYFSGKREVATEVTKKDVYEKGLDDLLKQEKLEDIFPGEKLTPEEARMLFLSKQQGGKGFYKEEDLSKPFISLHVSPLKLCSKKSKSDV